MKKNDFINRLKPEIKDNIDFSKLPEEILTKQFYTFICLKHGEFKARPESMLHYGTSCPKCKLYKTKIIKENNYSKNIKTEEIIEKCKQYFPNYDYSKVVYKTMKDPIEVTCNICGTKFYPLPQNIIRGHGCPVCSQNKRCQERLDTKEIFIEKAIKIHGTKYDYSLVEYVNSSTKVKIKCPKHGIFEQTPGNHINCKQGCPECAKERIKQSLTLTTDEFIQKVKDLHPGKQYIFDKTVYTGHGCKVIIGCPKHGYFETFATNFINKSRNSDCPFCSQERLSVLQTSTGEKELVEFIKQVLPNTEIIENSRQILSNHQELDIYIPDKQLAIEFDGIYWHSDISKNDDYHLQKTIECENNGIQLIHIFETEWYDHQEIIKSRLKQILGVTKYKIPARKCKIKPINDSNTERLFLENNHLQSYVASQICYGLYYFEPIKQKEYLVALMSFGKLRSNLGNKTITDNTWEMYRFCNLKNFTVIGGASKLFKYFINKFQPDIIISFANRRYSSIIRNKTLYDNLGFKFDSFTKPSYYYIVNNKLINRFNLRKDILVSKYGCPEKMSEREFCYQQGWYRLYDVGNLKYIWKNPKHL